MGQYIHFTEEQKLRAGSVDLEEFLQRRGEKLVASGREKRLTSNHSITVRGSEWYDHATRVGGNPISFVERHYGLCYSEAVKLLLGGENGEVYPVVQEKEEKPKLPFALPSANRDMRRMFAYLIKQRHIDPEVISAFVKEKTLYEDMPYHNAVFVGRDEHGIARHAHKRSTNSFGSSFRMNVESSDPRCSFHHVGTDGTLFVFEAPIDLMSFITMFPYGWEEHSYVACCGTSFQPVSWMLERIDASKVYLCLDNDKAGQEASDRMEKELLSLGLSGARLIPTRKDWNEDLVAFSQRQEAAPCQTMFGI